MKQHSKRLLTGICGFCHSLLFTLDLVLKLNTISHINSLFCFSPQKIKKKKKNLPFSSFLHEKLRENCRFHKESKKNPFLKFSISQSD